MYYKGVAKPHKNEYHIDYSEPNRFFHESKIIVHAFTEGEANTIMDAIIEKLNENVLPKGSIRIDMFLIDGEPDDFFIKALLPSDYVPIDAVETYGDCIRFIGRSKIFTTNKEYIVIQNEDQTYKLEAI